MSLEKICQTIRNGFGMNLVTLHSFYVNGLNSKDRPLICSIINQIKKDG